jgi:hypothetical protein
MWKHAPVQQTFAWDQLYEHIASLAVREYAKREEKFSLWSMLGLIWRVINSVLHLGQLGVMIVRSEKIVAETEGSSGTQRKGNVHR